ncbi:hypothetical protein [Chromobacterium sphagni]|nr:hypothetical protein [Chromobacterium sphagni]
MTVGFETRYSLGLAAAASGSPRQQDALHAGSAGGKGSALRRTS